MRKYFHPMPIVREGDDFQIYFRASGILVQRKSDVELILLKKKEEQEMREGMKVLLAGVLMGVVLLTGCGRDTKLPDSFDEETVREESEKAVDYFNERDYQSIIDMGSDELKSSMTAKAFADQCDPYLDKRGEFEKIEKTVVMGNVDKETGNEYGGVVMICKYKEGKIQFTIGFDEEMKLVQFLIK